MRAVLTSRRELPGRASADVRLHYSYEYHTELERLINWPSGRKVRVARRKGRWVDRSGATSLVNAYDALAAQL